MPYVEYDRYPEEQLEERQHTLQRISHDLYGSEATVYPPIVHKRRVSFPIGNFSNDDEWELMASRTKALEAELQVPSNTLYISPATLFRNAGPDIRPGYITKEQGQNALNNPTTSTLSGLNLSYPRQLPEAADVKQIEGDLIKHKITSEKGPIAVLGLHNREAFCFIPSIFSHMLITGDNGAGKTSLLNTLRHSLETVNPGAVKCTDLTNRNIDLLFSQPEESSPIQEFMFIDDIERLIPRNPRLRDYLKEALSNHTKPSNRHLIVAATRAAELKMRYGIEPDRFAAVAIGRTTDGASVNVLQPLMFRNANSNLTERLLKESKGKGAVRTNYRAPDEEPTEGIKLETPIHDLTGLAPKGDFVFTTGNPLPGYQLIDTALVKE